MSLHRWLQNLRSVLAPRRRQRKHARRGSKRAPTHRPNVEILEDRRVPASLAPVVYNVGDGPVDVKVGDFNNDGRLDLVTANYNTVSVLLGNADGTFQQARTSAAYFPVSLVVGDFDQDGKLDLVTCNDNLELTILLGHGDGTFAPPAGMPSGIEYGPSVLTSVATGDLNADGKLDIVRSWRDSYGYLGTFVSVLLGNGDGTFAHVSTSGPQYFGNGFESLALADFDGDGNDDVALAGGRVKVVLSNGGWLRGSEQGVYWS
jgi:hypothetical protein